MRAALAEAGLTVTEVLRVDQGRWWSYWPCEDPDCCPAEGTPYDLTTSAITAGAVVSGLVVRHSREDLAATVAALTGPARERMSQATTRAERDLRITTTPHRDLVQAHLLEVQKVMTGALEEPLTDDQAARLTTLMAASIRLRDEAWVRCDPDRHLELWRDLTRRAEQRYVPAPASLLAYTAFLAGDGALANLALDRAQHADPQYSMATLVRAVIEAGISPQSARLRMTPEDLAQAWEEQIQAT
jgi:hypothetical protein